MSPSYVEEHKPYFFSQRRDRQFHRRLRKTPDDVSVFGDKREALRADGESVVSAGWARARSALRRGSAASSRRVTLSGKLTILPPVDKDGPKLVSAVDSDTKSVSSENKQSPEDNRGARPGWTKAKEALYKFNELKFGSTSILSNLAKCLELTPPREDGAEEEGRLDPELLRRFLQDYQSLTADTVVEKREWQTDCYLDLSTKNKHPFLTAPPPPEELEEEGKGGGGRAQEVRRKTEEAIAAISKRYARQLNPKPTTETSLRTGEKQREREKEKRPPKRVTMNQEVMSRVETPRRPHTAHSVISNMSFRSDYSRPSSAGEDTESHFDMLPAELRPSIVVYKRESMAPKVKVKSPRTRLERYRDQKTQERGGRHVRIKSMNAHVREREGERGREREREGEGEGERERERGREREREGERGREGENCCDCYTY